MSRTTSSKAKIVAVGATVAVALLALAPGAWAQEATGTAGTPTGSPSATAVTVITNPGGATEQSTTVTGTETATVGSASGEGGVALSIPAASMPPGSTVTVRQPPQWPALTSLDDKTATMTIPVLMDLEAVDSSGNPVGEFDEPVTVRVNVPNMIWDIARVYLGDNLTVRVKNTNAATGVVTEVDCTIVDAQNGVVDCALPHFSEWSLEVSFEVEEGTDLTQIAPTAAAGPATPAPADTGTGLVASEGGSNSSLGMLLGIAAVLAAAGGLGARFAVKRARVE